MVIVAHCHEIEHRFLKVASLMLTGEKLDFPVTDTMVIEEKNTPTNSPTGSIDGSAELFDAQMQERYSFETPVSTLWL